MQDELEYHPEDYCPLTYEYWCDLLSTIKVKDESKMVSGQINKIAFSRESSLSDSNNSLRIPRKKKDRTGVLRSTKYPKKAHKHHSIQHDCVLCNKAGMIERKYMLHSSKDFTGMCTNRTIKDGIIVYLGGGTDTVKQYRNSENKWKKDLKALKNQNKMIHSIAKKSGSRCEIKKINNISAKASNKGNKSFSDDSDSNSLLGSNSSWDTNRRPAGRKEINGLYHIVTDNLNNYKYQSNEAINSESTFDTSNLIYLAVLLTPTSINYLNLRRKETYRNKCCWSNILVG